jgi:hypothetical protein
VELVQQIKDLMAVLVFYKMMLGVVQVEVVLVPLVLLQQELAVIMPMAVMVAMV